MKEHTKVSPQHPSRSSSGVLDMKCSGVSQQRGSCSGNNFCHSLNNDLTMMENSNGCPSFWQIILLRGIYRDISNSRATLSISSPGGWQRIIELWTGGPGAHLWPLQVTWCWWASVESGGGGGGSSRPGRCGRGGSKNRLSTTHPNQSWGASWMM